MDKEKRKKYEKIAKLTGIIIGLVLVLGISYAVFKTVTLSDKTNEISAGKLDLRIEHEQDEIIIEKAYPIEETEGLKRSPYVFDVVNEGTIDAAYDLYIEVDESVATLSTSVVKYYLTVEEDGEEKIVTSKARVLSSEEVIEKEGKKLYKIDRKYINTNKTNKYKLYLWIDYDATVEEAANKRFEARVVIEGEQIYDKNRLVKQIDVSENGDNSVVAYMYADGRVVLKGKGTIASNLSNTLVYEKEGILENFKKKFIEIGCNEEEVDAITTIEELEEYLNSLSEEKQNYLYASVYKDVLEEMGYDTSKITDMDSLEQYLLEQGLLDEEGNATEKGEEFEQRIEEEINNKYSLEPIAPKKIELEDGITNIPTGLFTGNEEIKEVNIPASVTSIGDRAFYGCTGIKEITLLEALTSIGDYAFTGCSSLTSIEIPNSVTDIGIAAFETCTSLANVKLPNNLTQIGYRVFNHCTSLISIEIPNSVTSIGRSAFSNCTALASIEIPNNVTIIDMYAFLYCTGLTSIKLSNNLTQIGDQAFNHCTSLISIEIPNSVTSIGSSAFAACTSLTEITIPSSVISIVSPVFHGWTSSQTINIDNTEEFVDSNWGGSWKQGCNAKINYLRS